MKRATRIVLIAVVLAIAFGFAGTPSLVGQDVGTASSSVVPPIIKFNGVMPAPGSQIQTWNSASAGLVTATFSLYEFQEGGSSLWSETQKVQLDEQGRYVVLLGATSSTGLPLDLFTSGKALWLGVQPQLAGAGELPRVLLVAVPYALKAADADTLGGKPASAYALAGTPTVVALTGAAGQSSASVNPAQPGSEVAGKAAAAQPLTACTAVTSDGTATTNAVAKFTAACNIEKSLIRDTGTDVAVGGTANPGALLDVQYTSTVATGTLLGQRVLTTLNPAAASSAAVNGLFSNALTASGNKENFTGNLFALDSELDHNGTGTLTSGYGMTGTVYNRATGTITNAYGITAGLSNVGKGKITNGYGVYVSAPTNATGGTFSNYSGLYIASPTAVSGAYGLYSAGGKNYFAGTVGIGTTTITTGTALEVNGTARFDGTGNNYFAGKVGIGTTTPSANLQVIGTATIGGFATFNSGGVFSSSGLYSGLFINTGGGDLIDAATSTTQCETHCAFTVSSAGNLSALGNASITGGLTAGTLYSLGDANITGTLTAGTLSVSGNASAANLVTGTLSVNGSGNSRIPNLFVVTLTGDGTGGLLSVVNNVSMNQNLNVHGTITKGGGSFKIDHPLDPANKYLSHSFVESPDMMNIYNGNVKLDAHGEAVIQLPDWFDALNRDFRYQLTAIGAPGPNLYVAEEVTNNHFRIAGGKPGMKVSWQVTGVRQDAWANAHRIPVEEEKPVAERGYYLHPELFGQPKEKGIDWVGQPKQMSQMESTGELLKHAGAGTQ
jgi:hypothetical protein